MHPTYMIYTIYIIHILNIKYALQVPARPYKTLQDPARPSKTLKLPTRPFNPVIVKYPNRSCKTKQNSKGPFNVPFVWVIMSE